MRLKENVEEYFKREVLPHLPDAWISNQVLKGHNNMVQSLLKNYIHIVFSTKHREPLIHEPVESELHTYLDGICKNFECPPIKVGGYTDHIHILCMLSKKIALMKLLEEVKSHSSNG